MASIQDSIVVARSAILAHQQRLNVTSNNIANVNTPGYHRQTVALGTNPAIDPTMLETRDYPISTGVRVIDVVREYNAMKEHMLLQQQSDVDYYTQRADALGDLEGLVNGDGSAALETHFQNFWNAWQDVANNADSLSYRSVLVERSAALVNQIQSIDTNITQFRDEIAAGGAGPAFSGMVNSDVNEINTIASELSTLNRQILYASSAYTPNDLMDQRLQLLQDLSSKVNITVGSDFSVSVGGQLLVSADGLTLNTLSITNTATSPIGLQLNGAAITVTKGTLAACIDTAAITDSLSTNLDTLASQLITSVNNILNSTKRAAAGLPGNAYDLDGNVSNLDFFTGTDASNISVSMAIHDDSNPLNDNLRRIAAAATRTDIAVPSPANPGDGARALEVADLANQIFVALNGRSFTEYFSGQSSTIGSIIQNDKALATSGTAVVTMLEDSIQSETGVNLDEEMMDMLSAHQAATRLFTTLDDMMDLIINRLG